MKKKPDWYKSRTFWIGVLTALAAAFDKDVGDVMHIVDAVLPFVLILLGVTERENAAAVRK